MDHEKPEVVAPQIREYISNQGQSIDSTEGQYGNWFLDESAHVEDRRERRGESLW
jgi:amino acid transporter